MPSKNRITINLSDDEILGIERLAARWKVSKAWLGRYAVGALIERMQNDQQEPELPLPGLNQRGSR
jgi:hypothetical protein